MKDELYSIALHNADRYEALARGVGGLSRVICLEGSSEAELVERIVSGRVTSRATGEDYHLVNDPPPRPHERLDPGPFERKKDDTEEVTERHLEAYRREADAVKEQYEDRGVLSVVDARESIDEVTGEILEHPETPAFYATSKEVE